MVDKVTYSLEEFVLNLDEKEVEVMTTFVLALLEQRSQ